MQVRRAPFPLTLAAALALSATTCPCLARDGAEADSAFFEAKVRPILVEHCHSCHGPAEQESSLRLDHGSFVDKGGDTGPVIDTREPAKSRLLRAISYEDVELQMPPDGKLPPEAIAVLSEWVKSGAPWPDEPVPTSDKPKTQFDLAARKAAHWCWRPIARPPVPTRAGQESGSAVDAFIDAKLKEKGLVPLPAADKRTLVRRLFFDLVGLPPTRADIDAFLADTAPDATGRLVDRLLAHPGFGERWARHWLDLVRYAETFGHEFDYPIEGAFEYRDYLIRALNADVPYDQLVREHIAGDLLAAPRLNPDDGTSESIRATAFWFFHEQTHAPVDALQHQADRIDNQVDTMGKTFLGLTLGCARCHDHKFDAISARDVYALWGYLAGSRMQLAPLDPGGAIAAKTAELAKLEREARKWLMARLPPADAGAGAKLAEYLLIEAGREEANGPAERAASRGHCLFAWHATMRVREGSFDERKLGAVGANGTVKEPGSAVADECFEDFSLTDWSGWKVSGTAFGERPTRLGDWEPRRGSTAPGRVWAVPGVADSGRLADKLTGSLTSKPFIITKSRIAYRAAGRGGKIRLVVDGYEMDRFNALLFAGLSLKVDSETMTWHVQSGDLGRYLGHKAHIEISDEGDGWIAVDEIRFTDDSEPPTEPDSPLSRRFLVAEGLDSPEAVAAAYGNAFEEFLAGRTGVGEELDAANLLEWLTERGYLGPLADGLAEFNARRAALAVEIPAPKRVLAIADVWGVDHPVYLRGKHQTPGETVPRRFLEAIAGADQPEPPRESSGRLELARWILAPENPLTARVAVNRVWYHLLGRGIVASVDNFGAQGTPPSHPELLDWLADWYRTEAGWSTKRLIKEIVLSRAYQRASHPVDGELVRLDPGNDWLGRANLRRIEGEVLRDAMLALSGRLDPRQFGPSVPIHLTAFMEGRGRPAESGPLDGAGRRSIYVAVRRNFLSPMMLAFDTPIPFQTIGQRTVSNVPAQALFLMNDPFVTEQARVWAARVLGRPDATPDQRIEEMFVAAFGRPPARGEIRAARDFLTAQSARYNRESEPAAGGEGAAEGAGDERVWADFAHALFGAKEFLFIQ